MKDYLYKYTTLESLALILKSRKIRLNPLSSMDDKQESKTNDSVDFSKYVFVSSWMNQPKESIAMWKLYGDMSNGVRIALKRNPFKSFFVSKQEYQKLFPSTTIEGDGKKLILPLEDCFGTHYFLQNQAYDSILKKIVYTDDQNDLFPKIVTYSLNGISIAYDKLGECKNTYWEFQNEERYILKFFPFDIRQVITLEERCAQYVYDSLNNASSLFKYKELEIASDAYTSMVITTAPNFSAGNMVILDALKKTYNPLMTIENSRLSNYIAS